MGQTTAPPQTVEAVLQTLRQSGVDVIYSSELVPLGMAAPPANAGETPLQRATAALAAHGLALRAIGPGSYVVMRVPRPAPVVADEAMDEVSVYASRYAIAAGLAEPRDLTVNDIERVPGSHDDALRALHSLPGIASNASARPVSPARVSCGASISVMAMRSGPLASQCDGGGRNCREPR